MDTRAASALVNRWIQAKGTASRSVGGEVKKSKLAGGRGGDSVVEVGSLSRVPVKAYVSRRDCRFKMARVPSRWSPR